MRDIQECTYHADEIVPHFLSIVLKKRRGYRIASNEHIVWCKCRSWEST